MKRSITLIAFLVIFFQLHAQSIENQNGLLILGGYNAYFLRLDPTNTIVNPQDLALRIQHDTTFVISQIPIRLLDSIREKSYTLIGDCKDPRRSMLFFPCTVELLHYSVSRLADTNCVIRICSKDICGPFKLLYPIEEFEVKPWSLNFNPTYFVIDPAINESRLTSWTPGMFRFEKE